MHFLLDLITIIFEKKKLVFFWSKNKKCKKKVVSYQPYYCKCSPMSRTCPFKENKGRTRNNRQAYVHWKTNLFFCERKIPQEFWKGFTYFACIHRFFVLHMQTWAMAKGRREAKRKLGFLVHTKCKTYFYLVFDSLKSWPL